MLNTLLSPTQLGALPLQNRTVMAPMTRSRADGNLPNALMATYYRQRAEAGLIVTEGVAPSPNGLGYPRIPGIFSPEQVAAWRAITGAVHDAGSRIFVQLMHVGRIGHPLNMPQGARLLAPSALAAPGEMFTDQEGPKAHPTPEAMSEADIEATVEEYVQAARNAREAGFDGVELHAANGYLIDQFLNTATNHRADGWGGTVAGRARFALEVARRTAEAIGAERVGIRLSPYGAFNGTQPDPDMEALYFYLAEALSDIGVAYIHLVDHSSMGAPEVPAEIKDGIRTRYHGALILSGGYDAERAEADLEAGRCDLVAFGRPFLANPNLVSRFREGRELSAPDFDTFYTPGEKGYTDYPS